jgi:nucleoside-diphosphate-sugar epimerase
MARLSGRRVVVTGGTGFIGAHTAAALADEGADVCLLDIAPLRDESAYVLRGHSPQVSIGGANDWAQLLACVKAFAADEIVHLGAIGDPAPLHRNPQLALTVNLQATVNVLEAARLLGVHRVVYFSSIGVLPSVRYEPIDAAHPVLLPGEGPGSGAYGASKVAGEAFCFAYRQSYGVDFAVIRPSAVYGLGMRHPIFVKPMVEGSVRGEPVRLTHGGAFPRDYTYVGDVASLAVALVAADALDTRIFYGATGRALVTGRELADAVSQVVEGADIEIEDALTPDDRLELRGRGVLSVEANERELGWLPRFTLEEGLREYAEAYRLYCESAVRSA